MDFLLGVRTQKSSVLPCFLPHEGLPCGAEQRNPITNSRASRAIKLRHQYKHGAPARLLLTSLSRRRPRRKQSSGQGRFSCSPTSSHELVLSSVWVAGLY